jgi:hypothetical protein
MRPTASHQAKGAEGQAKQETKGRSQQTKRVDTQEQTQDCEHLHAVVLNKALTVVHGLKDFATVINQQW